MFRKNVPLVQQVVDEILSGIDKGNYYRENGLLPSEADLGKLYGVSRATVREALSRLEQSGVVIRRHGVGTFVTSRLPLLQAGLEKLESIETLAERIGLKTQMGEYTKLERPPDILEMEKLHILPESLVFVISRVILAENHPIAFLVDTVPSNFLRITDLDQNFSGSVLDFFLFRGIPALSHACTEISNDSIDAEIGRMLQLPQGERLLKMESLLHSQDGQIVDYSLSFFVPGYFRFHVVRVIHPFHNRISLNQKTTHPEVNLCPLTER